MTAPIALFVYRRPSHTRQTIEALKANPEASRSPLYIFSDGPRSPEHASAVEEVRAYIRDIDGFASVTVTEQERNLGLADSIVTGVTQLCEEYGRIIVLEDDLVVAEGFLDYMNRALDRYADDERVMQVGGHSFLRRPRDTKAYFMPFVTSLGWGTWARAWANFDRHAHGYQALKEDSSLRHQFDVDGSYPYFEILEAQLAGKVDSWAIYWHLNVFMKKGLTLYPPATLIEHTGFGDSGTHNVRDSRLYRPPGKHRIRVECLPTPAIDAAAFAEVKAALRELHSNADTTTLQRIRTVARRALGFLR